MIASAVAVVERGGVLRRVRSQPPLTIRQIYSEDPQTCALCLVGTAAGPLAGDAFDLDLTIGDGARAVLTATGATLAQGRPGGAPAHLRSRARVSAGASLVATPPPLIVCAGSRIEMQVVLDLDASARLVWREVVVLGRDGEAPGAVVLGWTVTRGGRPVLRQRVDLTAPELWPGLLRGRRVLATELRVGPDQQEGAPADRGSAEAIIHTDLAVEQPLGSGSVLLTVIASDAASAEADLAALREATGCRSHTVPETATVGVGCERTTS